jgi:hypothetical protein
VRVKPQPDVSDVARIVLEPPTGVLAIDPIAPTIHTLNLDVGFRLPVDGGARLGLASPIVTLASQDPNAPTPVPFTSLRDEKWKIPYETGGAIPIEEVEDVVICLTWRLEAA